MSLKDQTYRLYRHCELRFSTQYGSDHCRIQGGKPGMPPYSQNSFMFMQFSAKNLQNNRLAHLLWELPSPPQENPGSASGNEFAFDTTSSTKATYRNSLILLAKSVSNLGSRQISMMPHSGKMLCENLLLAQLLCERGVLQ